LTWLKTSIGRLIAIWIKQSAGNLRRRQIRLPPYKFFNVVSQRLDCAPPDQAGARSVSRSPTPGIAIVDDKPDTAPNSNIMKGPPRLNGAKEKINMSFA
jgi:hypothetical protein